MDQQRRRCVCVGVCVLVCVCVLACVCVCVYACGWACRVGVYACLSVCMYISWHHTHTHTHAYHVCTFPSSLLPSLRPLPLCPSFSQPDAKLAQLVGLPGEMSFRKGQTDKEFEKVCFESELGVVHGPVKTQFGYHLILPKGICYTKCTCNMSYENLKNLPFSSIYFKTAARFDPVA